MMHAVSLLDLSNVHNLYIVSQFTKFPCLITYTHSLKMSSQTYYFYNYYYKDILGVPKIKYITIIDGIDIKIKMTGHYQRNLTHALKAILFLI